MLKFNIKEHKIEELTEYGTLRDFDNYYFLCLDTDYMVDVSIDIRKENFVIELDVMDCYNEDNMSDFLDMLYELIKDGLIIKEYENGKQ